MSYPCKTLITGAHDDLDKVRQLAYNQIKQYGMGDSTGLLTFPTDKNEDFQLKPYSKYLQNVIDEVSSANWLLLYISYF